VFKVLHSNIRDETASGRNESCLHASRLRNRVLYCIRSSDVRLPGARGRQSCLFESPGEMAKGYVRNRASKLPDCWLIIRSYFGEALFHTPVQTFNPPSREYGDWMGNVDGFDRPFKWSSIRPSRRSSDLPLPCRYRCISLRIVVVSCPIS
jgi:hypothetical protein